MNIIELKLLLKVNAHFKIMNHDIIKMLSPQQLYNNRH